MNTFSLTVVQPEKMLFRGEAREVIVPGKEGTMSILSRHAPLLASLKKGKVKIIGASFQKELDIDAGFVEVSKKSIKEDESFVNIFVRQTHDAEG